MTRSNDERALPRVLYAAALNPSLKFGSLEEQALCLAVAFRDRGGLFLPFFDSAPGGETARAFSAAGVPASGRDLHQFSMRGLFSLLRLIWRERIDVVHWNFYHPMNPYVLALSILSPRTRHMFTDHNSRTEIDDRARGGWRGVLRSFLMRRYSVVLCVSQFILEVRRREGGPDREVLATHFVNTDRFLPSPEHRARLRQPDDGFVALVVAHLIREKGVDLLLDAMVKLPPQVRLWVVGDGVERVSLEEMARALGIADRVEFFGSQVHVQPFMQAADCLVCPSRWAEAAGLVNIEALACGLPVIASRIGGIPEIVRHEHNGLLFESGDAVGLADAMQRLVDDADCRARFGEQGRRDALDEFSPESRVDSYLEIYREVRRR